MFIKCCCHGLNWQKSQINLNHIHQITLRFLMPFFMLFLLFVSYGFKRALHIERLLSIGNRAQRASSFTLEHIFIASNNLSIEMSIKFRCMNTAQNLFKLPRPSLFQWLGVAPIIIFDMSSSRFWCVFRPEPENENEIYRILKWVNWKLCVDLKKKRKELLSTTILQKLHNFDLESFPMCFFFSLFNLLNLLILVE